MAAMQTLYIIRINLCQSTTETFTDLSVLKESVTFFSEMELENVLSSEDSKLNRANQQQWSGSLSGENSSTEKNISVTSRASIILITLYYNSKGNTLLQQVQITNTSSNNYTRNY